MWRAERKPLTGMCIWSFEYLAFLELVKLILVCVTCHPARQHLPAFEINSHVKEEQSAQEEIQELRGGSGSEREEVIDGLQAAQIAG